MAATTNIHGFNIGGNNNSFDQRGHFYRGVFSGNVSGMLVKQNSTPNMTVIVEHGSALLNKNTISASVAEIKADTSVTLDTANTSNPRIDTVVIYEDTSVAIPTVEANYWQDGAGGRFKIVSLPGTAAASPVALTDANIQSAIGAGKPWARLADTTVPANSTTILNSNIADKRKIISTSIYNYGTAGVLTIDASGNVSVLTSTTDSNGWTVRDDITGYKMYIKTLVATPGLLGSGIDTSFQFGLPTGQTQAQLSNYHVDPTVKQTDGETYNKFAVTGAVIGSSNVVFSYRNVSTATFNPGTVTATAVLRRFN